MPYPLLEQAIAAVQAGDLDLGRRLLARVLQDDPSNAQAWLWLSTAVDDLGQRAECLRRVIALDPQHRVAWERLAALTSEYPQQWITPSLAHPNAIAFKCPHCGGEQRFDVTLQGLRCDHCGQGEPITSPSAADEERAVFGMLDHPAAQSDGGGSLAVECRSCGATISGSSRQGTLECPFCGSETVVGKTDALPVILPQALVPFRIDEKAARAAIHRWWGRGWLHPPDLHTRSAIQRLRGVYIPFWTFDDLLAARTVDEDHYVFCDDYLVCGSYSLPEKTARQLEPFDTKQLVAYRPEYLIGWPAEVSQLSLADASIRGRERMVLQTRREFPLNAQVTEVSVGLMTYKHVLLPVWVGSYVYRGRTFAFAVNGQTGKVTGQAPHTPAILFDALTLPIVGMPLWASVVVVRFPELIRPAGLALASAAWIAAVALYGLSHLLGWRNKVVF